MLTGISGSYTVFSASIMRSCNANFSSSVIIWGTNLVQAERNAKFIWAFPRHSLNSSSAAHWLK